MSEITAEKAKCTGIEIRIWVLEKIFCSSQIVVKIKNRSRFVFAFIWQQISQLGGWLSTFLQYVPYLHQGKS